MIRRLRINKMLKIKRALAIKAPRLKEGDEFGQDAFVREQHG
jgi:hypothetical protein